MTADPPSDLVSTDEIDGDSDPLVKPGTVGGDEDGIRVARMITSLCFLRIGLLALPGIAGRGLDRNRFAKVRSRTDKVRNSEIVEGTSVLRGRAEGTR